MAHTITPWRILSARTLINIKGPNGEQICQLPMRDEANAIFVVCACNAHDDLVRELSKASTIINKLTKLVKYYGYEEEIPSLRVEQRRGAIEKALP